MAKGKKYEAAEKHFLKEEAKLKRQIKEAKDVSARLAEECKLLMAENERLKAEAKKLRQANAELMKTANLSEAEVQELVKRSEALTMLTGLLDSQKFGIAY